MVDEKIRFPTDSDHLAIIGRNGSGKTVAAGFNFGMRNWVPGERGAHPWVIINSKGDEMLNKIGKMEGVTHLKLSDPAPKHPGVYMIRPIPVLDDEALDAFLWKIWRRGKIGVWGDEGYMLPRGGAFNAILTQGRSLKIPLIVLIQRPVFVSKFVTTESNFIQLFDLSHDDDKHHIRKFMPYDAVEKLPPYHSLWYDVKGKKLTTFGPVPPEKEILEGIRQKLQPTIRFI